MSDTVTITKDQAEEIAVVLCMMATRIGNEPINRREEGKVKIIPTFDRCRELIEYMGMTTREEISPIDQVKKGRKWVNLHRIIACYKTEEKVANE